MMMMMILTMKSTNHNTLVIGYTFKIAWVSGFCLQKHYKAFEDPGVCKPFIHESNLFSF